MLHNTKEFRGAKIAALDGDIGHDGRNLNPPVIHLNPRGTGLAA